MVLDHVGIMNKDVERGGRTVYFVDDFSGNRIELKHQT